MMRKYCGGGNLIMSEGNGAIKELTEIPVVTRKRRSQMPDEVVVDPRDARIEKLDRMVLLMRKELEQYRNDLTFWKTAHGAEYPARRIVELAKTVEEINA